MPIRPSLAENWVMASAKMPPAPDIIAVSLFSARNRPHFFPQTLMALDLVLRHVSSLILVPQPRKRRPERQMEVLLANLPAVQELLLCAGCITVIGGAPIRTRLGGGNEIKKRSLHAA